MTPAAFRCLLPEFSGPSWSGWNAIEDATFGQPVSDEDLVRRVTRRAQLPSEPVAELWVIAGRGAGKSRFTARLASFFSCAREYSRAPGEQIFVGVFAPDRRQGVVTLRYIKGLLRGVPALAELIVGETQGSLELSNGVVVEVITASIAAPRGRSYALVIVEEAAFLPSDNSADPDRELLRSVRPALARVPGSLLVVISSPYARRGELYRVWREGFGQDDAHRLVVQADTRTLNPTFSQREIDRAYVEDPVSASAEYGAEFRSDVEGFIAEDAVDAVIGDRAELPYRANVNYRAGYDGAGGSLGGGDSATLAIAHDEASVSVLDLVREVMPPFNPENAVAEFAAVLQAYGITQVTSDRWAGEWPRVAFEKHGIRVAVAELPKSDLYRALLPRINSRQVELRAVPKLRTQLLGLERRVARGGKDSIDHRPGAHDDVANAAALVLAAAESGDSAELREWMLSRGEDDTDTDDDGDDNSSVRLVNASRTGVARYDIDF